MKKTKNQYKSFMLNLSIKKKERNKNYSTIPLNKIVNKNNFNSILQHFSKEKIKLNTYNQINKHNYKLKLEKIKNIKLKKLKLSKKLTHKLVNLKTKYNKKNNINKKKLKYKNNIDFDLNIEIFNKILYNKFKKKYDNIIENYGYKKLIDTIDVLENYINDDYNFFQEISKKIKFNLINFKQNFLEKIKKNKILEIMIILLQKLYFYIGDNIINNFKIFKESKSLNYKNLKDIFFQINEEYKNINTFEKSKIKENDIFYYIINYKKNLKLLDKLKIKKNNLKKSLLENLEYFKNISKNDYFLNSFKAKETNRLKKDLNIIKLNIKEEKIRLKLDKIQLKEVIFDKIYNNKIYKYGIFNYIKIMKNLNIEMDFKEFYTYYNLLDLNFLTNIYEILDNINLKKKITFNDQTINKKKFYSFLGLECKQANKINDIKNNLIRKFIFKNEKFANISSSIIVNNSNYEKLLNDWVDLFKDKISQIIKKTKNNEEIFSHLSLYFGENNSKEIISKFKNCKNDRNIIYYNFFKNFLN